MNKRDRIDDIVDIVLPIRAPIPEGTDEHVRAGLEAVAEELMKQRATFERYLRVAEGNDMQPHGDLLLNEVERARTEMLEAEERMRLLIAYGREFITPQPYPLKRLAAAAGMSISGTRGAYMGDEIASVAERIGRKPSTRNSAPEG